ncbi:MAG: hypothetical protein O3B87_05875, partial [bacterium]|nr:hypothetical protein [bacterium]
MKSKNYFNRHKSVRVLLMGGAGNQLFQISRAATRKTYGEKVELLSLSRYQDMVCRFTGWSNHEDWIDVKGLAN